jgi:hypothetical protein
MHDALKRVEEFRSRCKPVANELDQAELTGEPVTEKLLQ